MIKNPLIFKQRLKNFRKNQFSENIAVLVGGTGFAQLLVITLSPIITRLYTPQDFGVLAIFISLLATFGTSASFKYQFAIPLPEKDEDAIQVLALSLLSNIIYTLLFSILLVLISPFIDRMDNFSVLVKYLWILPLSILSLGIYQSFKYWSIREKKFKYIAQTKISQNVAMLATQIGIGFMKTGPLGLLIGDAIGRSGGSTTLIFQSWRKIYRLRKEVTFKLIFQQAIRYKRFPMYSTGSGLINSIGLQMTPVLIAGIFGPTVAGLYALNQRVSGAPMKLIGESFGIVYYKEAADKFKQSRSKLRFLFLKQTKTLLLLGLIPVSVIVFLGARGFAIIFGNDWAEAGLYAQILAPVLLVQFAVVPLSQTLNILEKQDLQLFWDIGRFISIALLFFLFHYFSIEAITSIILISVISTLLYIALFFLTLVQLKKKDNDNNL